MAKLIRQDAYSFIGIEEIPSTGFTIYHCMFEAQMGMNQQHLQLYPGCPLVESGKSRFPQQKNM